MTRLALASLAGLLLLAGLALPEARAQSTTIELHSGWNNVAYHGETLPVERALANAAPTVSAVWHWDAATASWRSYFPAVPTIATLTALQPDRVYWLLATQAAVWDQPDDIRFAAALAEITTGAGARHLLRLELADSPPQRSRGLMFRPTLDPDSGMLFLFPAATGTGFWMRDTLIPLSIAFLDEDGRILEIQEMLPLSLTLHTPATPYHAALEVNQGWFEANGVGPGATLRLVGA